MDVYSLYRGNGAPSAPTPSSGDEGCYLIGKETTVPRALMRAAGRVAASLASPVPLLRLISLLPGQPRIVAEAIHAIPRLRGCPVHYDIVHAHFGLTGLLALALRRARILTGPLVTTFHGVDLTRDPALRGPSLYVPLFESGEQFTVNSTFSEQRALSLGAPPERVHKIPAGVEVSTIPFDSRSWRPGTPIRLLSVGRLEPVKGLRFGLTAVAQLVGRGHDVQYTIVGAGRLDTKLREEADRLGIADRVRFTGSIPYHDVLEEYGRNHVFLMPGVVTGDGQQEAQGRVLVEAQASGMPVVATRVGGIPETLGDGAGFLVEPEEPNALADAVEHLLEIQDRWAEIGLAGRRHVEQGFDAESLLDGLMEVYREASVRTEPTP